VRLTRPIIGWSFYDFANSSFATTILAVIFNRYFAEVIAGGPEGLSWRFFGHQILLPGSAVWSYLVSFSTALVAISSPLLGAMADRAGWRKRMLIIYCYLGVAATLALASVGRGDIGKGILFFIIAYFGFAGGNVFYNALLLDISKRSEYGKVSGLAWGFGYLGGGLCLALNLVMLEYPQLLGFSEGAFGVRDCILIAGVWWGLFAIPTVFWVHDRPAEQSRLSLLKLTREGWRRLLVTAREIRRYRQLVRFLIAFLLFNDGIETVIIMASIFGAEVVGMSPAELVLFFLIIQGMAMLGSFFFGWLADIIGNKRTLLITLVIWVAVVLWAFKLGWLAGLKTDYYLIGLLAGLVLGGSQSTARAMQAAFTPHQRSAEFFGFFSVSGKFAGIFGTFIYGSAIVLAGGVQGGILVLGVFFILGGVILLTVREAAGVAVARE